MKKYLLNLSLFLLFTASFLGAFSMPGGGGCTPITGDACTNPLALNLNGCLNNNTSNADCGADFTAASYPCGASQDDMFFSFNINQTRCWELDFTMTSGMGGSLNMMLIDGACSSLLMSECGTGGSVNMLYTGTLDAGTYVVCVSGATAEGAFTLCADLNTAGNPPSNDDCSSTQTLNTEQEYTSTNLCATTNCDYAICTQTNEDCDYSAQGPNCNGSNMATCWGSVENSVWYEFTPTQTGDHYVQLYNQNCNTADGVQFAVFSSLDCNDAGNTAASEMACTNNQSTGDIYEVINFTQGVTYYIAVDGFAGAQCDFNLFIGEPQFLPIEYTSLYLDNRTEGVRVHWKTGMEKNNEKFVVEWAQSPTLNFKNDDESRKLWEEIAEVPGMVSSTTERSYSISHDKPVAGYNFYRIKQIDLDGSQSTSRILTTFWGEDSGNYLENNHSFTPNPFDSYVQLNYMGTNIAENITIKLFSIKGDLLANYSLTSEANGLLTKELNTQDLPTGIYFYELNNNSQSVRGKILKK